jgi:MFS family permease
MSRRAGHRECAPAEAGGRPVAAPVTLNRHWRALPAILLGSLMAQFDLFVVNIAAPSLQAGLHTTTGLLQLAVGGYSLTYGTLLIAGGRLGDVFGPRALLRTGMISFAIASGACALCQTGPQLVAARLAQGACAAVMVPQVLALVTRLFPPAERGKATAWFGVTLGLGAVLGQALGGFLVTRAPWGLSWRMIFLVVLPVAALGAYLVGREVPAESSRTSSARPASIPSALAACLPACCSSSPRSPSHPRTIGPGGGGCSLFWAASASPRRSGGRTDAARTSSQCSSTRCCSGRPSSGWG